MVRAAGRAQERHHAAFAPRHFEPECASIEVDAPIEIGDLRIDPQDFDPRMSHRDSLE